MRQKKNFLFITAVPFICLLASCGYIETVFFPETQTTITFTGSVLESNSGDPLENVLVQLDGVTDVTNSAGQFSLSGVSTGPGKALSLSKQWFVEKTYNVNVKLQAEPGEFYLNPVFTYNALRAGTLTSIEDTAKWVISVRTAFDLNLDFGDGVRDSVSLFAGETDTIGHVFNASGPKNVRLRLSDGTYDTLITSSLSVGNNHRPAVYLDSAELDTHYYVGESYTLHFTVEDTDRNMTSCGFHWGDDSVVYGQPGLENRAFLRIPVPGISVNQSKAMKLWAFVTDAAGASDTAAAEIVFEQYLLPVISAFKMFPNPVIGVQNDTAWAIFTIDTINGSLGRVDFAYTIEYPDTITDTTADPPMDTVVERHSRKTTTLSVAYHSLSIPAEGFTDTIPIYLGVDNGPTTHVPLDTLLTFTMLVYDFSGAYSKRTAPFTWQR